jgi:hypothetical protein
MTYALCGFANITSIGIQIGGIGAIAPSQRENLAQLGLKALHRRQPRVLHGRRHRRHLYLGRF